jgi:hypothetical protein
MSATGGTITMTIGRAEALVLFEMLTDFYRQPVLEIDGPAERLALVRLYGALEKTLVEPFMPDYRALVAAARSELAIQSSE